MDTRNIINDLASVGVSIKHRLEESPANTFSMVFTITSKIHKGSPFTHPISYSKDYPIKDAYKEVAEYWAKRLGYGYKTVFGAI